MKRTGRVVTTRVKPTRLSVAVAEVFGRRLPAIEERVLHKRGKRIASTLVKV
jgi:hypothetical protein